MKVKVRHLKLGDKYKYYDHQKQYHCEVIGFESINAYIK